MENFLNLTNVVILLTFELNLRKNQYTVVCVFVCVCITNQYQSNFKEYGLHIISMLLFCACNLYDESIRRIH